MNAPKDFRTMTADTIGKDLLSGLVTELRLLPKPWPELPKGKQDDIIDRLRARVETNVKMAVHLLAAQGRTVVTGDLDAITIKDGVKATVKFSSAAPNLHELYAINKTIGAICSTAALSLYHGVAESRTAALQAVQAKLIESSAKNTLKGAALYKFTEFVDGLVDTEEEGRAA